MSKTLDMVPKRCYTSYMDTAINTRYPGDVLRDMRRLAKQHSRSFNREVMWALRQYIEQNRKELQAMNEQEQKENALIVALCRECGDQGTDEKLIDGFRGNYPDDVIRDAANGDVAALVELRQGCGLPIL